MDTKSATEQKAWTWERFISFPYWAGGGAYYLNIVLTILKWSIFAWLYDELTNGLFWGVPKPTRSKDGRPWWRNSKDSTHHNWDNDPATAVFAQSAFDQLTRLVAIWTEPVSLILVVVDYSAEKYLLLQKRSFTLSISQKGWLKS